MTTGDLIATPATSFRLHLQAELARRCARNPRYSLRSFARHLAIDHSSLSQILRGKRTLARPTIERLADRLGLDQELTVRFAANERLFAARAGTLRREVRQLTEITVNLLSDWYHFAILELLRLDDFRPDVRWIARVLGIEPDEVAVALQRLIRLRLLSMAERDRWIDSSGDTAASFEDFTQVALERFSQQVRELSLRAVREVPCEYRDHSAVTLAIDTGRLGEARELLARLRRELVDLLEQGELRDDVYHLQIDFYPVTRLRAGPPASEEEDIGSTRHPVADHLPEPR